MQGILSMCCFSQLSLLSSELALAIRIDPFCLFPREVSLKVLGHLDAMSLGRAAQVSKTWRALADDDLLWRNMCEQHIERKCEKCGWGLPLLSEKRRRLKGTTSASITPENRQLAAQDGKISPAAEEGDDRTEPSTAGTGNLKRSITAAANAAALEKHSRTAQNSRASSPNPESSETKGSADQAISEARPAKRQRVDDKAGRGLTASTNPIAAGSTPAVVTRPWKSVYCERLAIERNWRRGRYTVRPLKGHTDGIMCLQFNEALAHPSFPIVITGSYDRTARVWNLDTGEELRVLTGHTRGVRCLQFDEAKLITGSMDRTLKIWNWRTGELIRTLEGHTEGIVCLNFNDHLLASGSADSNIKIWNFKTGQCFTLRGHTDWVNSVWLWSGPGTKQSQARVDADAAENTFLFSASDDGTIRLWDLVKKECLMVYSGHVGQTQGLSLVHMPEEVVETLAMGGSASAASATGGGSGQQNIDGRQQPASSPERARASQESTYYTAGESSSPFSNSATGLNRGQSCSTTPSSGGPGAVIPEHFYDAPASGQHRHALRKLSQNIGNKIDPRLLKLQARLQAAGLVNPLPLDPEMGDLEWGTARRSSQRNYAGVGGVEGELKLSSHSSSSGRRPSPGGGGGGSGNTGSSGGHQKLRPMLFSCSLDNTIKIWDVRTGLCIRTLFGHMAGLWALSTDRLRLATASHDSTLKIWELATGKHLFSICEHRGPVTCVQIGDDKVISGSDDGQVNIYSFAAA